MLIFNEFDSSFWASEVSKRRGNGEQDDRNRDANKTQRKQGSIFAGHRAVSTRTPTVKDELKERNIQYSCMKNSRFSASENDDSDHRDVNARYRCRKRLGVSHFSIHLYRDCINAYNKLDECVEESIYDACLVREFHLRAEARSTE